MRPSKRTSRDSSGGEGLLYLWWRRRRRPTCVVDGCDVYVVDADADDVIDRLDGDVLGVDVEWPSRRKARCAVLQIASKNACVVIRVGSATCLPPRTTLLLKRSICVGVGTTRGLRAHPARRRLCLWPTSRLEDARESTRRGSRVVRGRVCAVSVAAAQKARWRRGVVVC